MTALPHAARLSAWATLDTPIGALLLEADQLGLTAVHLPNVRPIDLDPDLHAPDLLDEARRQLSEYFAGQRREFSLMVNPAGSPFDTSVWRALVRIPYGRTTTYGQLARALGRPDRVRAVGGANARNPLPIVVPCHRVVGSDGTLVGYRGGLGCKQALLDLEAGRAQETLW